MVQAILSESKITYYLVLTACENLERATYKRVSDRNEAIVIAVTIRPTQLLAFFGRALPVPSVIDWIEHVPALTYRHISTIDLVRVNLLKSYEHDGFNAI